MATLFFITLSIAGLAAGGAGLIVSGFAHNDEQPLSASGR